MIYPCIDRHHLGNPSECSTYPSCQLSRFQLQLAGSQTMRLLAMMTLERYVRICALRSCSAVPWICSLFFSKDSSGS